jgi:hypothetical protein
MRSVDALSLVRGDPVGCHRRPGDLGPGDGSGAHGHRGDLPHTVTRAGPDTPDDLVTGGLRE